MTAKDNRLFAETVFYRYRAGILWRDLSDGFGHWSIAHTRFSRFMRLFESLSFKKILEILN
ncbi:MAG: transposase [Candidatus Competibacteraceae bacterium]|nr:transposase [Candidatus Competibacteraceae bacterium]MBK7984974.1 transposase [Candidatus Competibacteraceae bacterium]MBK8963033.1 transposase [Candidatus Competibacteraceae bacterium]MBK9953031.1 transposase [Candidatus Competibacteraceae bacterium]